MRDEIVGGLRNALDRGESLEQAMQSFINAGYSPLEVREAVKVLPASATSMIQSNSQEKSFSSPQPSSNASTSAPSNTSSSPSSPPVQPLPQIGAAKPAPAQAPKANTKLIVGLSIVLILLIIAGVGSFIWLQNKGPAI